MAEFTPIPIEIDPTFTPETDNTSLAVNGFITMDKIHFVDGKPETLGGWAALANDDGATISGVCRTLYSQLISTTAYLMIGTNTRLYVRMGSQLTNITPLVTSSTNLGNNPITTYKDTLGGNPFTTALGSKNVTVAHASHRFQEGDSVTISLAATTNGIPDTDFNTNHILRSVVPGVSYVITVPTAASSAGTGGGASVAVASGLITVADNAHGLSNGDRVALAAVTNVGGILAAQINKEHIIRNKSANAYDIMTAGLSTSGTTGGGTAPATRRAQISAGLVDASTGMGYSAGEYSTGLYSSALSSASILVFPRAYSMDAYGNYIILTPGQQTGVYEWDGATLNAPAPITNAPTAINFVGVDREFIITLGAGGIPNRVYTSDRGQRTTWVGTKQNEVYDSTISGAGKFICFAKVSGVNILFTDNKTYTMRYLGKPAIWEIKEADANTGIISSKAFIVVNGTCFFMGKDNLFACDSSGIARPLLTDKFRKFIFENINRSQQSKSFVSYRNKFSEVIVRWCSAGSNEIDRWLRYNIVTGAVSAGTKDRTAEESPFVIGDNPRAISSASVLYKHEYGVNDDASPMSWYLETNYGFFSGKNVQSLHGVVPDSIQTGNITFTCSLKDFPQSQSVRTAGALTVSATTEQAIYDETIQRGKMRKYRWEGNTLNGAWRMGVWHELVKESTRRV